MTRRGESQKDSGDSDQADRGALDASTRSSVGYRDMIIIISAGSGLVMNVMVGQIYAAPWWVRLASGLVIFAVMLVLLQLFRGLLRWFWRLTRR